MVETIKDASGLGEDQEAHVVLPGGYYMIRTMWEGSGCSTMLTRSFIKVVA